MNNFNVSGKTVILRKKAISVMEYINSQEYPPNEAPNVFYIPLTSSDKYGRPEFPSAFLTEQQKEVSEIIISRSSLYMT